MYKAFLFLPLLLFSFIGSISAQSPAWELKKDENGIKIYVRENAQSSFNDFKGVTTIPGGSAMDGLKIIMDVNNYEAWFPDCSDPKILEQIDAYHDIHYIGTISPWPADDRCGVYEQTAVMSNNDTKAEIVFVAKPDYPIDEDDDKVRITDAQGKWTFEEKDNVLIVTYEFQGNPGGDIPAWLANSFVVKHPFETLESFKEMMAE